MNNEEMTIGMMVAHMAPATEEFRVEVTDRDGDRVSGIGPVDFRDRTFPTEAAAGLAVQQAVRDIGNSGVFMPWTVRITKVVQTGTIATREPAATLTWN